MARVKIKLADNIARVVFVETDATIGSTLGVDFKLPDGSIATVASLASLLGIGDTNAGITAHRLLQGLSLGDDHPQYTRKDTLTTRGDLYVRGPTTVQRFGIGSANQVLRTDGTDPVWHTFSPVITLGTDLSGSATLTDLGSATLNSTIVANAVTDSKLRQSAALSVIGRSANSTGNVADISAGTDGDILRRSGTSLGFGNIGANPSVTIGLTAKNGTANSYIRSDGAPALDVSIAPTWSGTHTFSNAPVVPNDSWAYAKIQNVSATSRFLGRITAGAGDIEELTGTQATTLLDTFTSTLKGLVPLSGGGTSNFLRADGTFAVPAGTTVGANPTASVGLTAVNGAATTYLRSDGAPALDVSISPTWSGTHTFSITPVVPATSWAYAKIQNVSATSRILGRITAGAGVIEELTGTQTTTLLDNFTSALKGLTPASGGGTTNFLRADGTWTAPGSGTAANPTASVGLTTVNGSASTYMRSDAAPPLDVSIAPTWTGAHIHTPGSSIVAVTINAVGGFNGLIVNGSSSGGIASFVGFDSAHSVSTYKSGATNIGQIGDRNAVSGGAINDFAVRAAGALALTTGGSIERVVVDGFGKITINAPSSGVALTVTSVSTSTAIAMGDGAVATPGLSFISDTDSGVYRIGANNIGVGVNGAKVLDISTTGLGVTGTMVASGAISGTNLSSSGGANPTASIGLAAVNGSAITFMRSDGAPAISQSISPTWTGNHTFSATSGVPITITSPSSGAAMSITGASSTSSIIVINAGTSGGAGIKAYDGVLTYIFGAGILASGTWSVYDNTHSAERFIISSAGNITINAPSSGVALTVNGSASFTAPVGLANYTVAGLPSAATAGSGAIAFVTDATLGISAGLGLTPIGGGANKVPVYSDGSAWKIG